jgi:hypothetical protein
VLSIQVLLEKNPKSRGLALPENQADLFTFEHQYRSFHG